MKRSPEEEIKRLRKKLKKYKKKNKKQLKELLICQEKRSGHWNKLVYEKERNKKLRKTLSSYPYLALKYALWPFGFIGNTFSQLNNKKKKDSITNTHASRPAKNIRDIKVALICDEFSYNSFKYEFNAIIVEPNDWREKFAQEKPDFFFCESAWSGIDSKRRPWQGKVYSSINFKNENRSELLSILSYCKTHDIPTVFWNKEDPTHFDDKIHDFIKTAINFDFIFTTDAACVQKYKDEYGCKQVFCLPFATQPKLFNPIESYQRHQKIIFAGSWYQNHKERCKDMEQIFDSILSSGKEIEIYDRYYDDDDEKHIFPVKYHPYIKPAVGHDKIDKIYKSSVFGLNINTVKESKTMFARRVYELMSSNTFVVSNYSSGVEKLLQNNVIFADINPDKLAKLDETEIDKIRDENLHFALEQHTYSNRVETLLTTIGIPFIPKDRSVTLVCMAEDNSNIPDILSFYRMQQLDNKKLLIILSSKIPDTQVAALYTKYNKSDVNLLAFSYLSLKEGNWNDIIETPYCAFMDYSKEPQNDLLQRALLHTSYCDDIIKMGSENKYTNSDIINVNNILANKKDFKNLLNKYNKTIKGSFYHV